MLIYFLHKDPKKTFFSNCSVIPRIDEQIDLEGAYNMIVTNVLYDFRDKDPSLGAAGYKEPTITVLIEDKGLPFPEFV